MAAVFIRYLDEKGKLSDVYFAVRDQHVASDLSGFKSYRATLEEKLQMPIASVDSDFVQWFNSQAPRSLATPAVEISADGGGVPGEYLNAAPKPKYCIAPNSPKQEAVPCDADDKKPLPDKGPVTKQ